MSIFIRQDAHASQKRQRSNGGFTLPEVLLSLVLSMFLIQIACQWGVLTVKSQQRMEQNQQAVFLAQAVFAELQPELPAGWQVMVREKPLGNALQEREITIRYENQEWQFYYAGETES